MKKPKIGMVSFGWMEKQDARKKKALRTIVRKLTPLSGELGDAVINDILSTAKEGLKETKPY